MAHKRYFALKLLLCWLVLMPQIFGVTYPLVEVAVKESTHTPPVISVVNAGASVTKVSKSSRTWQTSVMEKVFR